MIILQSNAMGSALPTILLYAAIFFILFFFFLRPQRQKGKEQEKFRDELTKGSEVVTASGIIGRINKIEGDIVHLQIDQKTFLRVVRGAISKEMTDGLKKENGESK